MKISAGILIYRMVHNQFEVLLVHPGGPFWKKKDAGAWTIPKGEVGEGEDLLSAAKREFQEELGFAVDGDFKDLKPVKQAGGKMVYAFALELDLSPTNFQSNTFEMEWPPKSGRMQIFPEIDKAEWMGIETANVKINPAQAAIIDNLLVVLDCG